jgi:hypothetical protein
MDKATPTRRDGERNIPRPVTGGLMASALRRTAPRQSPSSCRWLPPSSSISPTPRRSAFWCSGRLHARLSAKISSTQAGTVSLAGP